MQKVVGSNPISRSSGSPLPERASAVYLRDSTLTLLLVMLHPWIVRRVGVHGRAAVTDGFGAQFEVPGLVAVDLA